MAEFQEFPKMARLSRDMIVTEKLDGTNACVVIERAGDFMPGEFVAQLGEFYVYAQSRTRFITPDDDNFGFAAWVKTNADELAAGLGEGRHFGEWWGRGIQRGYGLAERRFSLFNATRWADGEPQPIPSLDPRAEVKMQQIPPACCHVVPVLLRGEFRTDAIGHCIDLLRERGSYAAPGFMKPEGVVVFHTAAGVGFKKTLDKDEVPKALAGSRA
jgi:hypothetical protein